ncbi:preprotein translocase subunit TatA [Halospeciosus flavus]|uniref:Preprotein translocase subunit TatA n=1 Tax=Halospeciosus flavus TaxID=3032283 RepID=A0ABD5Z568_9EURY|nr:preprotein translocase subunit TatA [Halospeciosus flavus]
MSVLPTFAGFPGGMEVVIILFILLVLFGGGAVALLGGGYLVLRSPGGTDEEAARIAELEREVADLRERLEDESTDEEGER